MRDRELVQSDLNLIKKMELKKYNKRLVRKINEDLDLKITSFTIDQLSMLDDEVYIWYLINYQKFIEMHYFLIFEHLSKRLLDVYNDYCMMFDLKNTKVDTLNTALKNIYNLIRVM